MAMVETSEVPRIPQLMFGAASPLWGYFGAAAMGGVAFWWMTRWTQSANLEAFFETASRAAGAGEAANPVVTPAVLKTAVAATPPVGGEAAPVSPALAMMEPLAEFAPEPRIIASPEPELPPVADAAGALGPAPKLRKAAPPADA